MTHSQEPDSLPGSRRNTTWRWAGLAVGTVLVVGAGVAVWRGGAYVHDNLSQWASEALSEALDRPVEIGDVEAIGPGGIRFGPSVMPPTPTDADTLALEAIDIRFNLLELLRRELNLTIALDSIDGYLEQAANGEWVALDIEPPEPEEGTQERLIGFRVAGFVIKLQTLRIGDGTLAAVPYPPEDTEPITIAYKDLQSRVDFTDVEVENPRDDLMVVQTQQLDFTLSGTSVQGGDLDLKGSVLLPPPTAALNQEDTAHEGRAQPQVHLNLRAQETRVADIMPIVESFLDGPLPVQFPTGLVSGTAEFDRDSQAPWSLNGLARVRDGTVVTGRLPEPVQELGGDVRFRGQTFEFEGVTARMGDLTGEAAGALDLQSGYDLAGQLDAFSLDQVSDLFGAEVPIEVDGTFVADVTMTGPLRKPVLATEVMAEDTVAIAQVPFTAMSAVAVLQNGGLELNSLAAMPEAGGSITGRGRYRFGQPGTLALSLTGDSLPADALGQPYGLPANLNIGPVFADVEVNGPIGQLTTTASWRAPSGRYPARGDLRFANNTLQLTDTFVQVAGGTVSGDATLANRQWSADLKTRGVQINQLATGVAGELTADARLQGSLDNPSLAGMQGQGTATAALVGGDVVAQGNLSGGNWTADVQGNNLRLAAFSPQLQGSGSGSFSLSGTTADLSLAGTRARGQVVLSDGLATATPVAPQLAAVRESLVADLAWNGQVIEVQQASTAGIQVQGTVTPQLQGPTAPTLADLDLNLTVDNYSLAALPLPDVVPVGGSASFNGRLTGNLNSLNLMGNASLTGLAVSELAFSSPLTGPVFYSRPGGLNVDLQGGADRIQVATNQGENDLEFWVKSGDAYAQGYRQGDELYARIENLPLDGLKLPPGGIDGIGTVSGTVDAATIQANLRKPTVRATFDIVDPGLGYISLQTVDVDPNLESGAMDDNGQVSGETVSSAQPPLRPEASTVETRYGRMRGTVTFADDVLTLVGVNLESASGASRYMASGTVTLGEQPEINGSLVVDNGEIRDVLLTLKIFEMSDFRLNPLQPPAWYRPLTPAEVADLRPQAVGNPQASLLEQIRRLAEIEEVQAILAAQESAAPFPPLDELRGKFSGRITANGPLPEDVAVTVNLTGRNWVWGKIDNNGPLYHIDDLTMQGRYQNRVITLNPVRLQSTRAGADSTAAEPAVEELAVVRLNGEFSLDRDDPVTRTLELDVANVPLDSLRRPLRLPSNLDGDLNIAATLTGSLDNPQMRGRLQVADATINREKITQASANFLYKDARLNLISNLAVEDNEEMPLNLTASIPYQLPIATQAPKTNDVRINLNVQNEGFALVNLFTQKAVWESGEASLTLNLTGELPRGNNVEEALTSLAVAGEANLEGVTLSSPLLPEPLTNIQGNIRVVNNAASGLNRSVYGSGLVLNFDNVRGDFSSGEVIAQGNLKVLPSINDLLPGLVDGRQSSAEPAPETAATDVPTTPPEAPPEDRMETPATDAPPTSVATARNGPLRILLDNIDLALKGLYSGSVDGEVVVDGAIFLLNPMVSGRVQLSSGVISLPETDGDQPQLGMAGGGSTNAGTFSPQPAVFENFDLVLGQDVRIAISGLVDVRAEGDLALVGTLPEVKPVGRINLPSGRINLLTTAFRLTGSDNYAEFRPGDTKIDPYLVATLATAVPDSAGSGNTLSIASPFPRNEISDAELNQLGLTQGGVETIRIRAQVDGRVSRVTQLQGVELSSTPPRSNDAIVALISGGVLTALESTIGSVSGGGDNFQGLIALAGSALLNNIQEILGDSLNLSELRLFSATPQSAQNSGDLDIGGEIGVNVSPNISVSVQKVFTNITPAIFNVRYRINDNLTLRGVTSYDQFNENTGALLEIQF